MPPKDTWARRKGCASETEGEENKSKKRGRGECERMAELLNAQTSLGGGGEHIVDSLLVITAVTFLTATFRALASG